MHGRGDLAQAIEEAREARAILAEVVRINPKVTHYRMYLALASMRLGVWLSATGAGEKALEPLRESSLAWERFMAENPASSGAEGSYNQVLLTLGSSLALLGRFDEAAPVLRRSCDLMAGLISKDPTNVFRRGNLMACKLNLAVVLSRSARNHEEAVACFQEADSISKELFGGEGWAHDGVMNPAEPRIAWAYCLREIGRVEEADRTVSRLRGEVGDNGPSWCELARYDARGAERLAASGGDARAIHDLEDRAMKALGRAVDLGFSDLGSVERIGQLARLRDRSEFQLLLLDIPFPGDPFAVAH